MEKQNDSMRERLLARLPQPENLAGYREETASLLAKHEKALFWEKMPSVVCFVLAPAMLMADWLWDKNWVRFIPTSSISGQASSCLQVVLES